MQPHTGTTTVTGKICTSKCNMQGFLMRNYIIDQLLPNTGSGTHFDLIKNQEKCHFTKKCCFYSDQEQENVRQKWFKKGDLLREERKKIPQTL